MITYGFFADGLARSRCCRIGVRGRIQSPLSDFKAGRADTSTGVAPLSVLETVVVLKPREQWPRRISQQELIRKEGKGPASAERDRDPNEKAAR
jgi:hypothetical protein